ncbi:MAG: thermonuclease family protein [bacterium]
MSQRRIKKLIGMIVALLIGVVAMRAVPDNPPIAAVVPATKLVAVEKVFDGDTIAVTINGRSEKVRFIGIDTPETHDPRKTVQCFGQEASDWTKANLTGRSVRLEADSSQGVRDKYDRLLAYIWRDDGLLVNRALIEQGYAHEYTYQTSYKYQAEFRNIEKQARENNRGLWSSATCGGNTKQPAR